MGVSVSIHQPQYFPWLGYLDKILKSDVFVILDNVPYSKNYFYNRNRIKGPNGWFWLTVPVRTKKRSGQLFTEVEIDGSQPWGDTHWKSLQMAYGKTPFFGAYADLLKNFYQRSRSAFVDLCVDSVELLAQGIGFDAHLTRASALGVSGTASRLLVDICRKLGATVYLSGVSGHDYLEEGLFSEANIEVVYQDYRHPKYPQAHGEFVPQLSALDLMFNCGKESLRYLRGPNIETVNMTLK